ncbi:MAG: hypothetical protein Q4F05_04910 [bacterium]|nr:hypothetical protein [bacterium]
MKFEILSGKFETGTDEQQEGYIHLFGEEQVQHRFDLYFHWFNLIHEVGHVLVEQQKLHINPVEEELFVNQFAVAYWRQVGADEYLAELKKIIEEVITRLPNPVPSKQSFVEFFRRIWGTAELYTVSMYGYFQLSCVIQALTEERTLEEILKRLGIDEPDISMMELTYIEASADNAVQILSSCISNLHNAGIPMPAIRLELVDNPQIQCCQPVKPEKSREKKR